MGAILTTLHAFLSEALITLTQLFGTQKCTRCDCQCYSDEQQFIAWRQKADLADYAQQVLDSGVLGRPMQCDICNHDRSYHGALEKKRLSPDMLPNGGLVHLLIRENEVARQRTERSARLNRLNGSVPEESLSTTTTSADLEKETKKPDIVVEDDQQTNSEQSKNERAVSSGDKIELRYKVFEGEKSAANLKQSELNESLTITVGKRDVIEGLDRGLIGAHVGVRRRVAVPANLAYGENDMVFVVEVLNFLSN